MSIMIRAPFAALLLALAAGCAPPAAASTPPPGALDLVESAPIETNLDHAEIANAEDVWPAMIAGATRSIDLAEFYLSNAPGSRLERVVQAVEAAADRGVRVRLLCDSMFAKKYPETIDRLAARPGVDVRRFNVGRVMGGVLHAKYFIVDGREVFLGSQNFDWRSITHIQEMGVHLRDAAAARAFTDVFALDWDLAAGAAPRASARVGSFPEIAAGERAMVTPVFSPRGFLPDPGSWDLPKLTALIDGAKATVRVQVLTYKTRSRDGSPFPDLDDALRRAAARGVSVELLVADWSKRRGSVEAVQALARVPGVRARFLDIPPWSGGFVPFARVAHAKYLVIDGARAWVGTSNWEGDYFEKSRNVGVIVEGAAFAAQLDRVFQSGFAGPYAEPVDPDRAYTPPKVDAP